MVKFIRVTLSDGRPLDINPEHIQTMGVYATPPIRSTAIRVANVPPIEVKETVDEIKTMIQDAYK